MDDEQAELERQYAEHQATQIHHQRVYQTVAIEDNAYLAPVDEEERSRLILQHEALYMLFDQRQIFPALPRRPKRILDCGFGTGYWCWQVKHENPQSEVHGIDINPTMVQVGGFSNIQFEVWNLNNSLEALYEPEQFDIVNSRLVAGGIDRDRWRSYLGDIHRILNRNGWCQMVEIYFNAQSFNGSLTEDHALRRWSKCYLEAMELCDKNPRAPMDLKRLMERAGFRDVQSTMLNLPMCGWQLGRQQRHFHRDHYAIGQANEQNVAGLLSSLALYPFTEKLGMDASDFHNLVAQAQAEAADPALQPYFAIYVCIGRKG